ncbi:hypothetical protein ANCDUO_24369 [Ancylostoma duodenale]|uniref:Uncharacterized protein n=1 Tax=Ancylostoma duodenale TaxID=51022 RepID=A0A0C2FL51_9BILA|nr:hypothetical protein ANCDUO_24369 [Ancylostoma duodenale]
MGAKHVAIPEEFRVSTLPNSYLAPLTLCSTGGRENPRRHRRRRHP